MKLNYIPLTSLMTASAALLITSCEVEQTEEGEMPNVDVDVEEGNLPEYDIDAADVDVEMKEKEIEVPDVDVEMEDTKIPVPDVDVDMPSEDDDNETDRIENEVDPKADGVEKTAPDPANE